MVMEISNNIFMYRNGETSCINNGNFYKFLKVYPKDMKAFC